MPAAKSQDISATFPFMMNIIVNNRYKVEGGEKNQEEYWKCFYFLVLFAQLWKRDEMNLSFRKLECTLALGISIVAFLVYLRTLCPTVDFIDSGELATVASTLGIAHPTGYPLFTLVGWIFSHLPFGARVIYQLNMMAAILCSIALFFLFRFFVLLLGETLPRKKNIAITETVSPETFWQVFLPSIGGVLILAFSETYWSTALSLEVYSLHILFLSLLLYLFTRAILMEQKERDDVAVKRIHRSYWFGFAYIVGLAFTNHMTTILLAPAFLYYFFLVHGFGVLAWKRILKFAVFFLLGFSVYLYLPIRSASNPIMNWGNPVDAERFLWHWTGKVYQVWLFASFENAAKQFKYFLDTLMGEFAYLPIFFAIMGSWSLGKTQKKLFQFLVLLFLGCVAYSINYDIHDIDSYFLLAYVVLASLIAIGLQFSFKKIQMSNGIKGTAVILVSLLPLVFNYQKVDASNQTLVEQYTKDMFDSIEPNGLVISYQWDYFISASYYFQKVESYRPDVTIIDKELLRRSWYFNQLATNVPEIVRRSQNEIKVFLKELYKFEHDLPYDSRIIESYYNALIHSLIEKNIHERPVYVTEEIEPQYWHGYQRVSAGLAYRLFPEDTLFRDLKFPNFSPVFPKRQNKYVEGIMRMYKNAYIKRIMYLYYFQKKEEAMKLLEKGKSLFPDFTEAIALEQRLN
jgi:hypothetical protein